MQQLYHFVLCHLRPLERFKCLVRCRQMKVGIYGWEKNNYLLFRLDMCSQRERKPLLLQLLLGLLCERFKCFSTQEHKYLMVIKKKMKWRPLWQQAGKKHIVSHTREDKQNAHIIIYPEPLSISMTKKGHSFFFIFDIQLP